MMSGASASASTEPMRMALVELHTTPIDADAQSSGIAPRNVAPGENFLVSGACIADEDSDDIHVVLSLADGEDVATGFHEMLVTDQSRLDGHLRVRAPDLKEARHHVFRVKLFVGESDPEVCDAGAIRIV